MSMKREKEFKKEKMKDPKKYEIKFVKSGLGNILSSMKIRYLLCMKAKIDKVK